MSTCEKRRLDVVVVVVVVIVTVGISYVQIMLNVDKLDDFNKKRGSAYHHERQIYLHR